MIFPLGVRLGSHGVIRFANYNLYELFTDVHTPPDMRAQSSLLLSKPVSPIFRDKTNLTYFLFPDEEKKITDRQMG